jgi:hypothetical protein
MNIKSILSTQQRGDIYYELLLIVE